MAPQLEFPDELIREFSLGISNFEGLVGYPVHYHDFTMVLRLCTIFLRVISYNRVIQNFH